MMLVVEYWFTVDGYNTPKRITKLENVTNLSLALLNSEDERPLIVNAHTVDFNIRIPEAQ